MQFVGLGLGCQSGQVGVHELRIANISELSFWFLTTQKMGNSWRGFKCIVNSFGVSKFSGDLSSSEENWHGTEEYGC